MRQAGVLIVCLTIFTAAVAAADQPKTFTEAQKLSAQTRRPVLLEFVHQD